MSMNACCAKKIAGKKKKIEAMHVHERGVGTSKCALRQLPQVRDVYCIHYHGLLQEYLAVGGKKIRKILILIVTNDNNEE